MSAAAVPTRNTRKRILEVAERDFARFGYEAAHMEAIATEVGVRKTALYHHFPSKGAIYDEIMVGMLDALHGLVDSLPDAGNASAQLTRLIEGLEGLLEKRRTWAQLFVRLFLDETREPVVSPKVASHLDELVAKLSAFFRAGAADGHFVDVPPLQLLMPVVATALLQADRNARGTPLLARAGSGDLREANRRLLARLVLP